MTDTKQRCGAVHPKKPKEVCVRDAGHVGIHMNNGNITWKDPKPSAEAPAPSSPPEVKPIDAVFAPPKGQEVPAKSKARKIYKDEPAPAQAPEQPVAPTGTVFRNVLIDGKRRDLKVHPAADIFDMLAGDEYERVKADVKANGLRHKPVLDDAGDLVDGRNRIRMCLELGIDPPQFERLPPGADVITYIISVNLNRRHMNETQRAFAADELSLGRATGKFAGPTQAEAAKLLNVSERSTRDAGSVRENAIPEVYKAGRAGKIAVSAAKELAKLPKAKQREIYEREIEPKKSEVRAGKVRALVKQEQKRETVRNINTGKVRPMPAGLFGVIYVDYPWKYENSDQHAGARGHAGYPQMPIEDILAHAREAAKRAAKDCVLALWVTNPYIHEIGRVIEAYGATSRTMLTWPKPRMGMGPTYSRSQTEHLVIATFGEPVHTLNEISTLLPAYELREHSRKPDEVAELLRKHCAGPFLELFAQEPREGWESWGAETQKFAGAA